MSFGPTGYHDETVFSLLSYYRLHTADENHVAIYTDTPSFYNGKIPGQVEIILVSESKMSEWKGENGYSYRVKVKVLQDAARRFKGNVLYVDTDTVFQKKVTPLYNYLSEGAFVMDASEGALRDNNGGIARKMKRLLKKQHIFKHDRLPAEVELSEEFVVWNSGTVGFNTQTAGNLFCYAENLIDTLYMAYPLYTMEQIAITYYLSEHPLKESKNYIHHYWYFKEFRFLLSQFFDYHKHCTFDELVGLPVLPDPWQASAAKRQYKKMSFWQKQWQKLRHGVKWKIPWYNPN